MNACCTYDFTASGDEWSEDSIKKVLKANCKCWCFQFERGETGYQHYQGRFSLKIKKRLTECVKLLGTNWHLSVTSEENRNNTFYVTKEDTRIAGPWSDADIERYIPRQIREIGALYEWQQSVVDDAKKWDTRHINIILDTVGNNGKSILKTYIGCHRIGRSIPFTNDYRDMMRMVMDTPKESLYIIDIPRALRKDQLYQFFSGIESLKDGYAYDDRYSFKEAYFDCPNIWVFMNTRPDTECLSKDRWVFWEIKDRKLLKLAEDKPPVTL